MITQPFSPCFGAGVTIAATTTSANQAFTAGGPLQNVAVTNAGTAVAFVRLGVGAQTATTADMAIAPNATVILTKGLADNIAAICASGTATIYAIPGEGH
ncbi:hypothetical protein ISN75_06810 [Dyella marensis]|uniref:hypothetical protein n=1 Tax=Dyella marensis TaxID=500610 RepID=UPI0031DA34F2